MLKLLLIVLIIVILFPPPIEKIRTNIRIIIGLTLIICILQKNEGFGNIDAEALQNMASLYNSSTGVLKVNNLEASGNITAKGYGQFGHAHIGTWGNDYAMFSHNKFKSEGSSYSMLQGSNGDTFINSKDTVYLRKNNNDVDDVRIKNGNVTAKDFKYKISKNQNDTEEVSLTKYNITGLKIDIEKNIKDELGVITSRRTMLLNKQVTFPFFEQFRSDLEMKVFTLSFILSSNLLKKYKIFKTNEDKEKENLRKVIGSKISNDEYKIDGNTLTFT